MTREEAIKIVKEFINGTCLHLVDQEALKTLIPELCESEDERIMKEINTLYADINACIIELLKARTDKDSEAESKAIFKMEGLMVATLQDLSCIEDYLEKQKELNIQWFKSDNLKNPDKPYIDKAGMFYTTDGRMCYASEIEKQKEQKPEVKHTGWVARDREYDPYFGFGLVLFKEKPRRSDDCWTGVIDSQLPWESFPDLKWEDEPLEVEVEITIRRK